MGRAQVFCRQLEHGPTPYQAVTECWREKQFSQIHFNTVGVGRQIWRKPLQVINLQNLIAIMIDDFDGNSACCGAIKGQAARAIEGIPHRLIDFRA
jgi:hypothetical protein